MKICFQINGSGLTVETLNGLSDGKPKGRYGQPAGVLFEQMVEDPYVSYLKNKNNLTGKTGVKFDNHAAFLVDPYATAGNSYDPAEMARLARNYNDVYDFTNEEKRDLKQAFPAEFPNGEAYNTMNMMRKAAIDDYVGRTNGLAGFDAWIVSDAGINYLVKKFNIDPQSAMRIAKSFVGVAQNQPAVQDPDMMYACRGGKFRNGGLIKRRKI